MSQQLKEFVKKSGVELQTESPSSVSTTSENNNLARELELELLKNQEFPKQLEKNIINNSNYGEFSEFVNNSNSNNYDKLNNNTKRMINNVLQEVAPPLSFSVSKLNPGMFNATVNKEFTNETRIDLKKILLKSPLSKTYIGEDLYIDTQEINGVYGRFQTGFSHTREYGKKGNLNTKFSTVQIKIKITNNTETKGGTVNFYGNGKVRFSGGFVGTNISNQPELIRRFIVNTYSEKEVFLYNPFEYNNLSGTFKLNGAFANMTTLTKTYKTYNISYYSYEPELSPFGYINYKNHKFIVAQSGSIQISGAKNPTDLLLAYNAGVELTKMMHDRGDIKPSVDVPKKYIKSTIKKVIKKRNIKEKTKVVKSRDPVFNIKINGIQCMRFSKPELVDFAKKVGVVGITKSTKKDVICKKINSILNKNTATFRNTNKKKDVKLSGKNKEFRIGGKRCISYSKSELERTAKILNISVNPKDKKGDICKKIELVRNKLIQPKPKPLSPKAQKQRKAIEKQKILNAKKNEIIKKRGMNENTIRKDIKKLYGDKWMKRYNPSLNNDVRTMKNKIKAINRGNKLGIPFKKDVNEVKKQVVNRWKRERKRDLETKYLMSKVNTTGIAFNLKNDYRRAAANYIMNQKNPPSNKKLDEYKKYWLKFRSNMNLNGNARRTVGAARARIEKI